MRDLKRGSNDPEIEKKKQKLLNFQSQKDMDLILQLLEDSEVDFSSDDDNDPTYLPKMLTFSESETSEDEVEEPPTAPLACSSKGSKKNKSIASATASKSKPATVHIQAPTKSSNKNLSYSSKVSVPNLHFLTPENQTREGIWKEMSFPNHELPVVYGCQNFTEIKTPLIYLEKYFPETHYEETVKYSKQYALLKDGLEISLSVEDIKKFYGVSIMMGCLRNPQAWMYWAHDTKNETISQAMTLKKFYKMRNIIHWVDTTKPDPTNKFWRIQPVVQLVRKRCNELACDITSYSIDEQMVPFTGRCPARQTIRPKPRPVGLKNLVCSTSKGLVIDFELFQGAGSFEDCGLGHGPSIVLRLVRHLPAGSHIYFDRFFTTVPLLERLDDLGFKATGTILNNRLGKRVHFPADGEMSRGDMKQLVKDNKVAAVKWCDTKCITIVSTQCGKDPVGNVNRWAKASKRRELFTAPAVFKCYNANMGGVDIGDQMLEYYRINMKTKKWPVKAFFHFLDVSIYNSWMEYKLDAARINIPSGKIKNFLKFKLELGTVLSKTIESSAPSAGLFELPEGFYGSKYRPHNAPDDIKFDRFDHWPETIDGNARKCRYLRCDSRTRNRCSKCKVYLCIFKEKDCFKSYHTKI